MKASIVDLRYKMKDVLKALERKEEVAILYRGIIKGRILPVTGAARKQVKRHPFFGMYGKSSVSPLQELDKLRTARTDDI